MAQGSLDPHGAGNMGSEPTQGVFIGWLGIGLLVFMLLFAIFVLVGATMAG